MKHFLIGASALAMLAACGADDAPKAVAGQGIELSDSMDIKDIELPKLDFKAKDYGQTDTVLTALKLDGSSNGIITFENSTKSNGGAVFTGLKITPEGDDAPTIFADKLALDGLHMTEAGEAAFDRMVLSNMSLSDEAEGLSLNVGDISVVKPNEAANAFFTKLLLGEDPKDSQKFGEWAFDRIAFSDLKLVGNNEKEGNFDISLNELSMGYMDAAVTGKTLLSGLKMDFDLSDEVTDGDFPVKGTISLDKVSLANLKADLIDEVGSDSSIMGMTNMKLMGGYTSPIESGFDQFLVDNLKMDVSGVSFEVPSMGSKTIRDKDGVAVKAFSPKTTFKLTADAAGGELGAQLAEALSKLGYSELEMTSQVNTTYNPETKETRYTDYTLSLKDGFSLSFNGGAFNLLDMMKAMSAEANGEEVDGDAAVKNIAISDLEFSLTDNSILDRIFNLAAEEQGMEVSQLKSMAAGMMAMGTMQASGSGVDMELVNQSVTALTKLIENSGTLTVKLKPDTPVTIGSLEDPAQLTVEKLGFTAETK